MVSSLFAEKCTFVACYLRQVLEELSSFYYFVNLFPRLDLHQGKNKLKGEYEV